MDRSTPKQTPPPRAQADLEIERVLQQTRWNRKEAAERLQISYKALLYKMKENGLSEGR